MTEYPEADSPLWWSIERLQRAYRTKELSPVEVALESLRRIEAFDGDIHAFVTVTRELMLEQAAAAQAEYSAGTERALLGVPVAIKDVFNVEGVVTTFGSLVYREVEAKEDCRVVTHLRNAGAVFAGKTNTPEFGQSATTENLLLPDTVNPWGTHLTPGGSSGGSAAAVAAGLCNVAVGSDGGGSIRIPAAFTGLVGLKPTLGLCHNSHGLGAMADFSTPGPLARIVKDLRRMVEVMSERSFPRCSSPRLRVGWCPHPEGRPVQPEIRYAIEKVAVTLEELGHSVEEVVLPIEGWREIFTVLVLADEHRERAHLLATSPGLLTSYERRSLEVARALHPEEIRAARHALDEFRRKVVKMFDQFDVLLLPTVAVQPFEVGSRPRTVDGEAVDRLWGAFPFAAPFSVAAMPAMSLPVGLGDGLPVSAQLVGRTDSDSVLLDLAEDLEAALLFDNGPMRQKWRLTSELVSA